MTTTVLDDFELVGASFRSAPFDVLERFSLSRDEIREFYHLARRDGDIADAVVLSTCNRTEIYARGQGSDGITGQVLGILRTLLHPDRLPRGGHVYCRSGRPGASHLFRVACGLDSLILGESQILGQVRDAYENGRTSFQLTQEFDRVMQTAVKVGRRSRADTEIGRGAVSVASAAVQLATRIFSSLDNRTVAIVGAGDTARLAAEHFAKHHPRRMVVLNRTLSRAESVAQGVQAEAWPLDRLEEALVEADVVSVAVSATDPVVTFDTVERVMQRRSGRSLALLDLGMPRNVATEVNAIHDVFLNDIESLKQVVDANLARRRKEVPVVERLIDREIDRLLGWQAQAQVGPFIAAFRGAVENMRQNELERVARGLSDNERAAVDRATRAVVNKLMHGPLTSIKEFAQEQETGAERMQAIRELFRNLDLDEPQ